jgi:hypothetical protein
MCIKRGKRISGSALFLVYLAFAAALCMCRLKKHYMQNAQTSTVKKEYTIAVKKDGKFYL